VKIIKNSVFKYLWKFILILSIITFLRETGVISLRSYQQNASSARIGGGTKGTIPTHPIQSGTLFFHDSSRYEKSINSLFLGNIASDLENRPTTYRINKGRGSSWEYPESIEAYNRATFINRFFAFIGIPLR
jgi:hypothetical protein